jgi:hypothetical protein
MSRLAFDMRIAPISHCLLLLLILAASSAKAQVVSTNTPDFDEVFELVRAHLAGTTDSELNRAAVEGLLRSLRGKVRLLSGSDDPPAQTNGPAIAKASVLDDHIAWLRIARVSATLPGEISRQCKNLGATSKLTGLILDLRFAGGDDYAAAAAAADLFVTTERPLLEWGNGAVKSVDKTDALSWPATVLVNAETTGAAEALAAVLRDAGVALILGTTTRGAAMTTQDFPLKNGQHLRIATAPVKLGDGIAISTKGVKPDIEVVTALETERAFLDDPYATTTRTNLAVASASSTATTNRPARRSRPNEADLVRARRDGLSLDGDFPMGRDAEPEKPVIRDPALARAVDLLKGLAVVRRGKS